MASDALRPWSLAPEVVLTRSASGAYLIDLDRGFFALDALGYEVLRAAMTGGGAAAIQHLSRSCGFPHDRSAVEAEALRQELCCVGAIARPRTARWSLRGAGARIVFVAAQLSPKLWSFSPPLAVHVILTLAWLAIRLEGFRSSLLRWRAAGSVHSTRFSRRDSRRISGLIRRASASYLIPACACKERAVATDFLSRSVAGLETTVVIGIRPTPFSAHAWAERFGRVLSDDPSAIRRFRRVAEL
jgi:hypothetical protein